MEATRNRLTPSAGASAARTRGEAHDGGRGVELFFPCKGHWTADVTLRVGTPRPVEPRYEKEFSARLSRGRSFEGGFEQAAAAIPDGDGENRWLPAGNLMFRG